MRMSMGDLRRLVRDAGGDPRAIVPKDSEVIDALIAWTESAGNRHVLDNAIIAGIERMVTQGKLLETNPTVPLYRGLVMSRARLRRWLQKSVDMPDVGNEHVNIIVGREGPSSWTTRPEIAARFAGKSKASVLHYIDDPVAVVLVVRGSKNVPGTFVDLTSGPVTKAFNSFSEEKESISLGPVTVDTVVWAASPESENRYAFVDDLVDMLN